MTFKLEDLQETLDKKDYEELKKNSEIFVEENPKNSKGYVYLGKASLKLFDTERARHSFYKAQDFDPNDLEPTYYLAQIAIAEKDLAMAKALYRSILRSDADNAMALEGIGDIYFMEENYSSAIESFKNLLGKGIKSNGAILKTAQAYLILKEIEEGLKFLEENEPETFDEGITLTKRSILMTLKKDEEARKVTEALHKNVPGKILYILESAAFYENDEEYKKAEALCTKALELDIPEDEKYDAYFRRANNRLKLEDDKGALSDFDESIKLNPSSYLYKKRADLRMKAKDFKGALSDLNKAIEEDKSSDNYQARGHLYHKAKKYDKAIEDFTRILKMNKADSEGYYGLGMAMYAKGEKGKALTYLQKAETFGHHKAKKTLLSKFPGPTIKLQERSKQKFMQEFEPEFSSNASSTILKKAFGKLWVPDIDKLVLSMADEIAKYPKSLVEKVLRLSAQDMLLITAEGILFFQADDDPIEAFYKIEMESPHSMTIELQPAKGGERSRMKLYESNGSLVVNYPLEDSYDTAPRYYSPVEQDGITENQKTRLETKVLDVKYLDSIEEFINGIA